jgi:hypothetical protein
VSRAVECEGSPRDLGRDQGRACAGALRGRFARLDVGTRLWLRLGGPGGAGVALRREISRHFPRQAEALAGISAAAGVPLAWLVSRLEREGAGSEEEIAAAAGGEFSRSGSTLVRTLGREWIVRRSRPEGGFRSVEATRPWLAHALLGVNEAGVAVAVAGGGRSGHAASGSRSEERGGCLPASPLAQDCLQRFATLEACLDWCAGRPGERPASLLFADANGEVAGIEVAPGRRRILRSAEGWLAVGGSPGAREALGKALCEQGLPGGGLAVATPALRSLRIGAASYEA